MNRAMLNDFSRSLLREGLSENTIESYMWTARYFTAHYKRIDEETLFAYKRYLMEHFAPQTVNLRLQGVNKLLTFLGRSDLKMRTIKIQEPAFLDNVISDSDYRFLKRRLKRDGNLSGYFIVWYLATTGARVSELIDFKVESVEDGFVDLYAKGNKLRRIFIPKHLHSETFAWVESREVGGDYLFVNKHGNRYTRKAISQMMRGFARKYDLDPKVMHPHSFRHFFAQKFMDKSGNIDMLANLLDHESIDTTRKYLRQRSTEQQAAVNRLVTW